MSDQYGSGTERREAERYRAGETIAYRARYDTPRIAVLSEELPELSDRELEILDEHIEKAIVDEVVRTLREQSQAAGVGDDRDV